MDLRLAKLKLYEDRALLRGGGLKSATSKRIVFQGDYDDVYEGYKVMNEDGKVLDKGKKCSVDKVINKKSGRCIKKKEPKEEVVVDSDGFKYIKFKYRGKKYVRSIDPEDTWVYEDPDKDPLPDDLEVMGVWDEKNKKVELIPIMSDDEESDEE